jgi:Ribose 5-phosphate isomerase A (phosphoriboisomerase A)
MSTAGADRDALKRAAADAAAELVRDGMRVGLGTGSTAAFELEALARRHRQGLRFVGIPTSEQTAARATALGSPLTSFTPRLLIDLTIDGAHEVERGTLNLAAPCFRLARCLHTTRAGAGTALSTAPKQAPRARLQKITLKREKACLTEPRSCV